VINYNQYYIDLYSSTNELINSKQNESNIFTYFNNYFIVKLNIFFNLKKINKPIIIPDRIMFEILDEEKKMVNYEYEPISVICHQGSSTSTGHYINYSKRPFKFVRSTFGTIKPIKEEKWFLYNDATVSEINNINENIQKIQCEPYIILFKQINQEN